MCGGGGGGLIHKFTEPFQVIDRKNIPSVPLSCSNDIRLRFKRRVAGSLGRQACGNTLCVAPLRFNA